MKEYDFFGVVGIVSGFNAFNWLILGNFIAFSIFGVACVLFLALAETLQKKARIEELEKEFEKNTIVLSKVKTDVRKNKKK